MLWLSVMARTAPYFRETIFWQGGVAFDVCADQTSECMQRFYCNFVYCLVVFKDKSYNLFIRRTVSDIFMMNWKQAENMRSFKSLWQATQSQEFHISDCRSLLQITFFLLLARWSSFLCSCFCYWCFQETYRLCICPFCWSLWWCHLVKWLWASCFYKCLCFQI